MKSLKPSEDSLVYLISTPSRFVGEFETEDILITHAWPSLENVSQLMQGLTENPHSRNYYIFAYGEDRAKSKYFDQKYDYFLANNICVYLSIFFGKRFDNLGPISIGDSYHLPSLSTNKSLSHFNAGYNNHKARNDLEIALNFSNAMMIEKLLYRTIDENFERILLAAGKFYLHSLQIVEDEPELAYLDLIMCGEVLSSFFDYPEDRLFSRELRELFSELEKDYSVPPPKIAGLKNNMMSIRRRYLLTVYRLLSDYFYENSESQHQPASLRKAGILKRINCSYDLRSAFVHRGALFGVWTSMPGGIRTEIQIGTPHLDNKKLKTLIKYAPTFFGLERIMRFCLLRFIHLYGGVKIDDRLND